jgi:hypothetical protein
VVCYSLHVACRIVSLGVCGRMLTVWQMCTQTNTNCRLNRVMAVTSHGIWLLLLVFYLPVCLHGRTHWRWVWHISTAPAS